MTEMVGHGSRSDRVTDGPNFRLRLSKETQGKKNPPDGGFLDYLVISFCVEGQAIQPGQSDPASHPEAAQEPVLKESA